MEGLDAVDIEATPVSPLFYYVSTRKTESDGASLQNFTRKAGERSGKGNLIEAENRSRRFWSSDRNQPKSFFCPNGGLTYRGIPVVGDSEIVCVYPGTAQTERMAANVTLAATTSRTRCPRTLRTPPDSLQSPNRKHHKPHDVAKPRSIIGEARLHRPTHQPSSSRPMQRHHPRHTIQGRLASVLGGRLAAGLPNQHTTLAFQSRGRGRVP